MTRSIVSAVRVPSLCVLAALLVALGFGAATTAEPNKPDVRDRHVTRAETSLLVRDHLSRRALDDEISQRCLTLFLESLDPWKLYFNRSDVDAFSKCKNDLDDMARDGDVSFAYEVFGAFLKRVDGRAALADELLAIDHDFGVDEKMLTDRDLASYPRTAAEARERWRKRIKYDLLMLKVDGIEGEEARKKLTGRYQGFKRRMHQTDGEELLEMFLTALAGAFDPHSSYMS
ncbi:MAG: carboxy terminal-processing peptidase, partial [Planctomycetota bacterium]